MAEAEAPPPAEAAPAPAEAAPTPAAAPAPLVRRSSVLGDLDDAAREAELARLGPEFRGKLEEYEGVKADRKRVKHEIHEWLAAFEQREGRAAEKRDKAEIKPLYLEKKRLEERAAALRPELMELKEAEPAAADNTDIMDAIAGELAADEGEAGEDATAREERLRAMQAKFEALRHETELDEAADDEWLKPAKPTSRFKALARSSLGTASSRALLGDAMKAAVAATDGGAGAGAGAVAEAKKKEPEVHLSQDGEAEVAAKVAEAAALELPDLPPDVADAEDIELFLKSEEVPAPPDSEHVAAAEALVREAEEQPLPPVVEQFEQAAPDHELLVKAVSVEEVRAQERAMEEARVAEARKRTALYQKREEDFAWREREAMVRLEREHRDAMMRLRRREQQAVVQAKEREQLLSRNFRQAEEDMKWIVAKQQAHVEETFGKVKPLAGGTSARRYQFIWDHEPQPIEMRFHLMRAVKDKLPPGRFVLKISLYDRLGGNPLRWTQLDEMNSANDLCSATKPVRHKGRFYDTDLRFDDSVFAFCPAKPDLRPGMVFIVELFQLAGRRSPSDRVVAWGAMPMATPMFDVVSGRFRIPLLRGEMDVNEDRYRGMENTISRDLGHWLANVYLEVRHLPRVVRDVDGIVHREFDVELDYVQKLLHLSDADRYDPEEERDLEAEYQAELDGVEESKQQEEPLLHHRRARDRTHKKDDDVDLEAGLGLADDQPRRKKSVAESLQAPSRGGLFGWRPFESSSKRARRIAKQAEPTLAGHPSASASGSKKVVPVAVEEDAPPLPDAPPPVDGLSAATQKLKQMPPIVPVTTQAELDTFQFAVARESSSHGTNGEALRKLRYLKQEVFAELGLSNWRTAEFWTMLGVSVLALWMRMYVHYLGQWVFLKAQSVPVYTLDMQLHKVVLKYVATTLQAEVELGVVAMGPVTNIVALVGMMATGRGLQRYGFGVPDIMSRFMVAFGLGVILDPLLVLLVDSFTLNFDCSTRAGCEDDVSASSCSCSEGDAFKLYERFEWEEGSGVVGIFLTVFLYVCLGIIALFFFYNYLLYVHMNGRMLDVFRRLHAADSKFLVPHDFEMCAGDVQSVCAAAGRWTGPKGTQRKILVSDYVLTDPLDPTYEELTTHLVVYHLDLDGSKQLYRHFRRAHDGTILEIFGDQGGQLAQQFASVDELLMGADAGKTAHAFFQDV